jgi:folate-binding protein YgfZ
MDDVTLSDVTNENGTIAIEGPQAAGVVRDVCGLSIEDLREFGIVETKIGAETCWLLRRSHFGQIGAEFIAGRKALPVLWQRLTDAARARGGGPAGYAALNALRIEAGIPWFGYDFDDSVIPQEAALESTHVSFSKGCYTGQEIVERVRSRGHVNRRRTGLEFSASIPPEHGAKLMQNDKEAGWVTSAAYSPRLARAIGMGYVRREQSAPGTTLECVTGGSATVAQLPFVDRS